MLDGKPQMNVRLARRIVEKRRQLDAYRPLDPGIVQRLHEDFRVEATYHSNAIEGNTLTLAETGMVLEYGLTIGGHPLREHLEVTNHASAYDALERLARTPIDSEQALLYDPVTRAAVAHHDFESLHPFSDGNGRVGRLLLNVMLLQDGYPPALILRDWRSRYIKALQEASTS